MVFNNLEYGKGSRNCGKVIFVSILFGCVVCIMLEVVFQSFLVDFGMDLGLFLELILDVHVHELPDAQKNEFESKCPPP